MSGRGYALIGDAVLLSGLWVVVAAGWVPRCARFPLALGTRATGMADSAGGCGIHQTAVEDRPIRAGGLNSSATSPAT